MKKGYQFKRYCKGELGYANYILKSELLIPDGSEMETASVENKTVKRKREDNPTALKKTEATSSSQRRNFS